MPRSRDRRNRIIAWIISLLVVLSMALSMAGALVNTRRVPPTPRPSPTPFPTLTPTPGALWQRQFLLSWDPNERHPHPDLGAVCPAVAHAHQPGSSAVIPDPQLRVQDKSIQN